MHLGIIGLGRMGSGIGRRLMAAGFDVTGYDRTGENVREMAEHGATPAHSLEELVGLLPSPRVVWMMVPPGTVDAVIDELEPNLEAGDIVVDGGNSFYKDSMRRADDLAQREIRFVDVGTSGGVWGQEGGYSMMVGGDESAVETIRRLLEALAPAADKGWGHLGPSGAGHFTKMVHNGIEYALMQAYAEGFSVLGLKEEFDLDLAEVRRVWQHGSVIRSWLLELIGNALEADGMGLEDIQPVVEDSGMGRWTVQEAIDLNVPAPILTQSVIQRIESRFESGYHYRLLAALRNQFGGHEVSRIMPPETPD